MTTKVLASNVGNNLPFAPVPVLQTLTDVASITWDMSLGNSGTVTLAGNRAVANPTNLTVGPCLLIVKQDATGSRTLTWGTAFKWPAGQSPILSTTGGATPGVDIISLFCDGTVLYGSYLRGMI